MTSANMIRTLEELSMNAWPALQTMLSGGWVLRFANGYTRRANSINPIYPSTRGVEEKITACEELYRAKNLRVVFKMTRAVFPENLDEILDQRGYAAEAYTSVQVCDLRSIAPPPTRDALLSESLTQVALRRETELATPPAAFNLYDDARWVDDYCRLNAIAAQHKATMTQMLNNIAPARCFIALKEQEQVIAVGLGVAENGFVGFFDLVTDEKFRGRGFGTQLILSLLDWGKQRGARRAYLQVMLGNAPALRLYEKLGFRELYQYWYRVKA
jgi:GNAT superfamily N-acetyltransferase